ncbi:type III secretion system outer membrane ring subunit SctC [Motilimonas pumila]|nr:type III secretion system outer membrane ring subunit SctC [Motilimonas pumila]
MSLSGLSTFCLSLLMAALLFGGQAQGKQPQLAEQPFEYYAEGETLREVLTALATSSGLSVNVSSSINDTFNGHLQQRSARQALDYLASAYDLIWYFDGSTLYVYKSTEIQSQIFRLNGVSVSQIKDTMVQLKIWDNRFDWRAIEYSGILMVSGPPRYLELVNQTVNLLQQDSDPSLSDPLEMRIFKLKHASAVDRKFTARGDDIVIPGVATMLANMAGASDNRGKSTTVSLKKNPVGKQKGMEINKTESEPAAAENSAAQGEAHSLVQIQADPSLNAVIVQDYRSRIRLYENLIKQLDQPREQLEISLVIIDLATNSLQEIGVDWQVKQLKVGDGLVDLILPGASDAIADEIVQTNADFLATVSALEGEGRARVTSRPAVVTENGIQAILDNNETFYVKVEGERVAELEAITYGTMLQVTPRIVEDGQPIKRIYLDLTIEDGNQVQDGAVDSLPTVKNTQISTRASVPEGASLLIGGYFREANTYGNTSVPGLGDIPYAGELFTHHKDTTQQMVRLFMISPKILKVDEIKPTVEDDLNQPFSFSDQITDMANMSNSNSRIFAIDNLQPCETSSKARNRRNNYMDKGYTTMVKTCRDLDGVPGYRVALSQCPLGANEPECRL